MSLTRWSPLRRPAVNWPLEFVQPYAFAFSLTHLCVVLSRLTLRKLAKGVAAASGSLSSAAVHVAVLTLLLFYPGRPSKLLLLTLP